MITAVTAVPSVPVRCIQVGNVEHLYLAGRTMIPTHNTMFAQQAAVSEAKLGDVLYLSLEMGPNEMNGRLLALGAQVSYQSIANQDTSPAEDEKIDAAMERLRALGLYYNQMTSVDIRSMRAMATALHRRGNLRMIVLDHIGLMSAPLGYKQGRVQFISEVSRAMKLLAVDLNIPVLLVSQLNRESTKRPDATPVLADLRDSGSIEQDGNVVILLHRDDLSDGIMKVFVAKNREGQVGDTKLQISGSTLTLRDAAPAGFDPVASEHAWGVRTMDDLGDPEVEQ